MSPRESYPTSELSDPDASEGVVDIEIPKETQDRIERLFGPGLATRDLAAQLLLIRYFYDLAVEDPNRKKSLIESLALVLNDAIPDLNQAIHDLYSGIDEQAKNDAGSFIGRFNELVIALLLNLNDAITALPSNSHEDMQSGRKYNSDLQLVHDELGTGSLQVKTGLNYREYNVPVISNTLQIVAQTHSQHFSSVVITDGEPSIVKCSDLEAMSFSVGYQILPIYAVLPILASKLLGENPNEEWIQLGKDYYLEVIGHVDPEGRRTVTW